MWVLCANQHDVLTARQPKEKMSNNNSNAFNIFTVTEYPCYKIYPRRRAHKRTVRAPLPHKYTSHECVTALQLVRREEY